jgi:hypothetical protein
MEISRATNQPPASDKLVVTGTITASGALIVTNIGPDIINGSRFVLFNKAVTGFSSVSLPPSDPANTKTYTWQNDIGSDGSITLLTGGLVNPSPTNITFSVSGSTLTLGWPFDHTGWQLLSNSVGITASNQWFPVSGSTSTNQQSLIFDPTRTNVFFRMVYPPQ